MNTEGVQFDQGSNYRIQFEAKADAERVIQIQTGELLSYDPWFDKFDPKANVFTITEDWETYSYDFMMSKPSNGNGNVLFEFGDVAGDRSLTTIYLDKVRIYKLD